MVGNLAASSQSAAFSSSSSLALVVETEATGTMISTLLPAASFGSSVSEPDTPEKRPS